jgi:DNA repair photolyase
VSDVHRGRGADRDPPSRFDRLRLEIEVDAAAAGFDDDDAPPPLKTRYFRDLSKSVLSRNESPDVPFRYSTNPYRGCEHGCVYCYARPSHEYLGFSAGLDFESKIMVKTDVAALLARELRRPSLRGEVVCLSGNTDPYQPIERTLGLTRACLEVLVEAKNPVAIITKSAGVARDADLLKKAADAAGARATVTITTLDPHLARALEPRASTPSRRLSAIRTLAESGVETGVNVAPIIPGLTDHEVPRILEAAAAAGARYAGRTFLRLPGPVEGLFDAWLDRHAPTRKAKVLARLLETTEGGATTTRFGARMRGVGPYAAVVARLFEKSCARFGLKAEPPDVRASFRGGEPPPPREAQGELFA